MLSARLQDISVLSSRAESRTAAQPHHWPKPEAAEEDVRLVGMDSDSRFLGIGNQVGGKGNTKEHSPLRIAYSLR